MAHVNHRRTGFRTPGYKKALGNTSEDERATALARQAFEKGETAIEIAHILFVEQDGQPVPWEVADPRKIGKANRRKP